MKTEIPITDQEFENIYWENTNYKAAKLLKISTTTLIKYVKERGIKAKGQGRAKRQTKLKFID